TKQYNDKLAELEDAKKRRDVDLRKAEEKQRQTLSALQAQQAIELRQAEEKYPPLLKNLEQQRDQALRHAEEKYRRTIAAGQQRATSETKAAEEKHARQRAELDKATATSQQNLAGRCATALTRVQAIVADFAKESGRLFPPFNQPSWNQWTPPAAPPQVIRF